MGTPEGKVFILSASIMSKIKHVHSILYTFLFYLLQPQRKYIGARVIEGCYTLIDPTESFTQQEENDQRTSDDEGTSSRRHRKGTITDMDTIRMPPSLTLSKIRNLKQQALLACIDSNIEISTVALACVYFERLALDCRVDKSNRRLTFAAVSTLFFVC